MNELISINCERASLRPTSLLYGDKNLMMIKSPNTYCEYQLYYKYATV